MDENVFFRLQMHTKKLKTFCKVFLDAGSRYLFLTLYKLDIRISIMIYLRKLLISTIFIATMYGSVTVSIGDVSVDGYTEDIVVPVTLTNPDDAVGGFQFDVITLPMQIELTGVEPVNPDNFSADFNVFDDGSGRAVFYSNSPDDIAAGGDGIVLNLHYNGTEVPSASLDLDMYNLIVSNADGETLESDAVDGSILIGEGMNFSLLINEIMQNPSVVADDLGEWFEVYNNSFYVVDFNGWIIKDADTLDPEIHTITSSVEINPGEYKVFGNNSNYETNGGVIIDYQYSDISLSNASDELILVNPFGITYNSVAWDNGATFPDPNGASMALLDPNLDNSLGTNWTESILTYGNGDHGTPGGPNFFSDITLNLTEIDFDTVNVNESGVLSLTISNEGNVPLQLDSLYTNSTLFTLLFTDSLIETSAELEVTFTPTELGQVTGTLYIVSNDPDESMVEVPLSGFGYYPAPDIELESTSLDFGGVMDGLTAMELFKVYNIGDAPLDIDTVYCTGNFSVMPGSGTVDATGNLELEVTFSPDDETSFTGTMTIVAGNDPDEDTLTVSLSGTGIAPGPDIAVSQEPLDFGVEIVPGDTITRQLVIYNTGLLTLEIEEIDITNSDANAPFWTEFEDAVIEPGDSVVIDVSFTTADAIHSASGSAIIYNNASNFSFSLIAGYILKIEDITTEPNATDTVDIFFNNDTEIMILFFTIPGFDDFSQLSVLNVEIIMSDWTTDNDCAISNWIISSSGNLHVDIWCGSFLEAGSGPIARMIIHNNYQTDHMVDLHFVSAGYIDPGWGNNGYDINLLRSGTITIVDPPPSAPTGLSAEFNDGILLTWNENNEDDFSHYVLDKSNDELFADGQYSSITITETSYIDTVYEDGATIYYRLSAVDSEDNVSDFSDVISIDLSPPSPPTGLSVEFDGGILLSWNANSESDFLHYILDKAADSLFQTDQYSSITTTETSYIDTVYEDGATIYYRLSAVDTDGFESEFSELVFIHVVLGIDDKLIPEVFALHQNYPNPFNPTTQIRYDLPEDAMVSITIYDIMGRSIRSLVNSKQTAGYRSIQWNATNDYGKPVSAGVYLYRLQAGNKILTRKMILMK